MPPAARCIGLCHSLGLYRCGGEARPATWARVGLPALIGQACTLEKAFQCADPWSLETDRCQCAVKICMISLQILAIEAIIAGLSAVIKTEVDQTARSLRLRMPEPGLGCHFQDLVLTL